MLTVGGRSAGPATLVRSHYSQVTSRKPPVSQRGPLTAASAGRGVLRWSALTQTAQSGTARTPGHGPCVQAPQVAFPGAVSPGATGDTWVSASCKPLARVPLGALALPGEPLPPTPFCRRIGCIGKVTMGLPVALECLLPGGVRAQKSTPGKGGKSRMGPPVVHLSSRVCGGAYLGCQLVAVLGAP